VDAEHSIIANANGRVKSIKLFKIAANKRHARRRADQARGADEREVCQSANCWTPAMWCGISTAAASTRRRTGCWYSVEMPFGEQMAEPKWKRFEKLIHQIHSQLAPQGAQVTGNDKIVGCESKVERQLDVTIRATVAQYKLLIVVECKDETRPIDVGAMGQFASLLRDVKANKGVMISTSGFTSAAFDSTEFQVTRLQYR
jgi:hypothetical protein